MQFRRRFFGVCTVALLAGCGGSGIADEDVFASINTYRVVFIPKFDDVATAQPWDPKGGMYVTTFDRKTRLDGDANNTGEEVIDCLVSLPVFKPGSEDKLEFLQREGAVFETVFRVPAAKLGVPDGKKTGAFSLNSRELFGDSFGSSLSMPRRFELLANGDYRLFASFPSTEDSDDLIGIVPPIQNRIMEPEDSDSGKFRITSPRTCFLNTFSGSFGPGQDYTPRFFGSAIAGQLQIGVKGVERKIFRVDLIVDGKESVRAEWRRLPTSTTSLLTGENFWIYGIELTDNGMSLDPTTNKAFASLYAALGTDKLRVRVYWGDKDTLAIDPMKFTDMKFAALPVPSGTL